MHTKEVDIHRGEGKGREGDGREGKGLIKIVLLCTTKDSTSFMIPVCFLLTLLFNL